MAILNQKRILNLIPKTSAPVTIHVSQGDVGTEIEFTLVKGDELFVNTGSLSASVHGIREDGANFGVFTCTLSGSSVKFPLHAEMTAVKGSAIAEIVLVDSQGNKVGSSNFGIMVEESVFPLGVTYDNDVSVYESILAYVQTIPAQVTLDYNTKIDAEIAARQAADSSLNEALTNEIGNRTSAVSGEAATRAAADTALGARIDNIVAPSGEAPSAAEVTDARVGYDGTTYQSLGAAIRTQITQLHNKYEDVYAYFGDGTYATWEKPYGGSYILTLPSNKNLSVFYGPNGRKNMSVADILTAASTYGLTVSGNTITGNIVILVFSRTTETIYFTNVVQPDEVVLYYSFWGSAVWGKICDNYYYIMAQTFNALPDRINLLEYQPLAYIAYGKLISWKKGSSGAWQVTFPSDADKVYVFYKTTRYSVNISDLLTAASTIGLTVSDYTVSGNVIILVFNTDDKQFHFRAGTENITTNDVVLYASYWASAVWGLLCEQWYYMNISNIDGTNAKINDIWASHMQQKESAIRTNMEAVGKNGVSFIFISDIHIENNDNYSYKLIEDVKKNTNLKYLISGGDYITQHTDTALAISEMRRCIGEYRDSSRCYLPIVGNHDRNTNFAGTSYLDYEMTENETYDSIQSLLPEKVVYGDYYYYYYDDEITKTRFILLDSGFEHYTWACDIGATQLAWARSVMDSAPNGYHIVVFVHGIYQPSDWSLLTDEYNPDYLASDGAALFNEVDGHNVDYPNSPVVAIFTGHIHLDMSTKTEGGVPVIWIDCDARNTSSGGYVANSTNSQCFDVVTIDYENESIKCERVGRGNNRTISYAST